MNTIYKNLARRLHDIGISDQELAQQLGLHENEIQEKMCGEKPWYLSEVVQVCKLLRDSNYKFIFQKHIKI